MKNCFSDKDMFFGGAKYKYSWYKHKKNIDNKIDKMNIFSTNKIDRMLKKLKDYKKFDGIEFLYDVNYPCDRCVLRSNKGVNYRFCREWCDKM